jgi:hypothetical protein
MRMFDPRRSWAVLIGTSSYREDPELADLPAVRRNLEELLVTLTDPVHCGFPRDQVRVIDDPSDAALIGRALHEAGERATDLLLIYYAGHGLIDRAGGLHLGLTGTASQHSLLPYSAVPYGVVRETVRASSAACRIVVLDCCFSGRAIEVATGPAAVVAGQLEIQGACTLASSSRTSTSIARSGARHTAFTGELLSVLRTGIPDGAEFLDLDTVYGEVRRRLRVKGLPEPQIASVQNAARLGLVRNRAVLGDPAPPEAEPPRRVRTVPRWSVPATVPRWSVPAMIGAIALVTAVVLALVLAGGDGKPPQEQLAKGSSAPVRSAAPTLTDGGTLTASESNGPSPGTGPRTATGSGPIRSGSPSDNPQSALPARTCAVPSALVGRPITEVRATLDAQRLKHDETSVDSAESDAVVNRVLPLEGQSMSCTGTVRLFVTHRYVIMDDLIGYSDTKFADWVTAHKYTDADWKELPSGCGPRLTCKTIVEQHPAPCTRFYPSDQAKTISVRFGQEPETPHVPQVC